MYVVLINGAPERIYVYEKDADEYARAHRGHWIFCKVYDAGHKCCTN